jgi:hypothetical protein
VKLVSPTAGAHEISGKHCAPDGVRSCTSRSWRR